MTNPNDPTRYPPPDPERMERALRAMRARRVRLRRVRTMSASGALIVLIAILAVALTANGGHRLRVEGPTSTTTPATTSTTARASTTSTTTVDTGGTQQIVYRPYTDAGVVDPGLRITARVTGTCIAGASGRTYRCFGVSPAGTIYDPCFLNPRATPVTLLCPNNPATPDVVELTTTEPPTGTPGTATRPWAFQLSNGEVCLFVSAAWSGLGPYDCRHSNPLITPADCRPPDASQPWWTAACQDDMIDASLFTARQVSKVWF